MAEHGDMAETSDENNDGVTDPDDVDLGEIRDELPADLDPSQVTAPYLFPNNSRRKIPAVLYTLIGIGCIVLWQTAGDEPCSSTAVRCRRHRVDCHRALPLAGRLGSLVRREQALGAAAEEVGFPAGHASAQLGWRGLRSRPTWRILLYSNEKVPEKRGWCSSTA